MSVWSVIRHSVVPERVALYRDKVAQLAERARASHDELRWHAYEVALGRMGEFYFASQAADYSELEAHGTAREMALRLFGEKEAAKWLEQLSLCLHSGEQTLWIDRPELSFTRPTQQQAPMAMVSAIRVRPDGREAFEEFARKVAEALLKLDEPGGLMTRQAVIGDLREYRLIRPLSRLADLGRVTQAADLLTQAFGPAEGGLLFREGTAAIDHVERRVVALRNELSNPA